MAPLPAAVSDALDGRKDPAVFTTVDKNGRPNAIYASCVYRYDGERVVIADNFFHKTRANISGGSPGALVFMSPEGKSYQLKGRIDYLTEGELFDFMKSRLKPSMPGHAAAVLNVEEAYSGAEMLV